jgi:hypothetical protein
MGEFSEAGGYSIIGYMMMNCATLGEAFQKASRYSRIVGNLIKSRVSAGLDQGDSRTLPALASPVAHLLRLRPFGSIADDEVHERESHTPPISGRVCSSRPIMPLG